MDPDYSVMDHINHLARSIDEFMSQYPECGSIPYITFALIETRSTNVPWDSFNNKYCDLLPPFHINLHTLTFYTIHKLHFDPRL